MFKNDIEIEEYLDSKTEFIPLPYDFSRSKERIVQQKSSLIPLSPKFYHSLKDYAAKFQVDFLTLSLAAFQALLYRYSSQGSFCTSVHFQRFSNTDEANNSHNLILEHSFNSNPSGFFTIKITHETLLKILQEDSFYTSLMKKLKEEKYREHPFNQILFHYEKKEELSEQNQISSQPIIVNFKDQHLYELIVSVKDYDTCAQLEVIYRSDLFKESTIKRILKHYERLLEEIVENPSKPLSQLEMLAPEEKQQILISWNDTQRDYPKDKTIHQLFEEQAEKTPDNIAVIFEDQQLTYQQLNIKSNQLAHYLRERGVKPDTLVAIAVERSLEMIVGILGILKAGGAYVPIDPSYPRDRIRFMLEDTQAPVLLTQKDVLGKLPTTEAEVFLLDKEQEKLIKYSKTNPSPVTQLHHLAYVIYTSGSTGKPKGVMIEHKNISNLLASIQENIKLVQTDRWLALTTITFDISGLEVYLPLMTGASLVITRQEGGKDPDYLKSIIHQKDISIIQATPSTWRILLDAGWQGKKDIKVLTGGEALTVELLEGLKRLTPHVYNLYGPTETTIWSTLSEMKRDLPTIGCPLANTQAYILDSSLNPLPAGIPGELYIGGKG